eukprot:6475579-Amphidinium_carterae.1
MASCRASCHTTEDNYKPSYHGNSRVSTEAQMMWALEALVLRFPKPIETPTVPNNYRWQKSG